MFNAVTIPIRMFDILGLHVYPYALCYCYYDNVIKSSINDHCNLFVDSDI